MTKTLWNVNLRSSCVRQTRCWKLCHCNVCVPAICHLPSPIPKVRCKKFIKSLSLFPSAVRQSRLGHGLFRSQITVSCSLVQCSSFHCSFHSCQGGRSEGPPKVDSWHTAHMHTGIDLNFLFIHFIIKSIIRQS